MSQQHADAKQCGAQAPAAHLSRVEEELVLWEREFNHDLALAHAPVPHHLLQSPRQRVQRSGAARQG